MTAQPTVLSPPLHSHWLSLPAPIPRPQPASRPPGDAESSAHAPRGGARPLRAGRGPREPDRGASLRGSCVLRRAQPRRSGGGGGAEAAAEAAPCSDPAPSARPAPSTHPAPSARCARAPAALDLSPPAASRSARPRPRAGPESPSGGRRGAARVRHPGAARPGRRGSPPRRSMHPPPPAAGVAMDFGQNSLFGYMEDLQELTIIERPVRRSLKVRRAERRSPQGGPPDPAASDGPGRRVTAAA